MYPRPPSSTLTYTLFPYTTLFRSRFCRNFQAEEGARGASGTIGLEILLGGVEGHVGDQRRLAHRGAAGKDDQVRRMHAAQHAVHVLQAGGDAAEATLLEGGLHGFDGLPDRILERDETAFRAALDRKSTRLNSIH